MRIVFMGTPDFAAVSLRELVSGGYEVVAVFTQPDKPAGRRQIITPPPVKELALACGIPVFQPVSLRAGEMYDTLRTLAPDVIVVVAYGRILPPQILELPPLGCINVHASLLPKYRGAAPIQWSIINGEVETGVTTMYMDEGLDTGDILLQCGTVIGADETAPELYGRLAFMGGECLIGTLKRLQDGMLSRTPQDDEKATYAPILEKKMGRIDFTRGAAQVYNQVRGLTGWPVAYTMLEGKTLKVHGACPAPGFSGPPGRVMEAAGRFVAACGEGAIELVDIQLEGGKRLPARQFLIGRPIRPGTILGA